MSWRCHIDRVAASKNYQKDKYREDSALRYYLNGKELHILHEDTRELLELLLYMLAAQRREGDKHLYPGTDLKPQTAL